ncbi:MAG: ribosome small subunit-dependent GTPase A [SAR202 cluster bacterium]|nr:ribosome small subunit-dependent GTPase A [SAR202 cluster bacterium]
MVEPRNFKEFDEDDVRSRPPRSSRPRTKDRPDYSQALSAFVIAVDRGRVTCLADNSEITAMKSRELGKKSVVVGDLVGIVGDVSGADGTLARVVNVSTRRNALTRTVDDDAELERMIVANVDQMAIVIASQDPEPRHGFVDRALVVAYDQAITPIIIMTKCDLADGKKFLQAYKDLDIKIIKVQVEKQKGRELDEIREILARKSTVLLGHSGVGKSTLVNALVESADRATGSVNDATGRGRHTSSSAIALSLAGGGWIIDTPGVRSFGVAHVDSKRVISAFGEFREAIEHCPKNCSHNEESCALNSWELDANSKSRLESLRRLLQA